MKGIVKWFDSKKGYGFIAGENEKDYFVHYSEIQAEGYKKLEPDQKVSFNVKSTDKGKCAVKVSAIIKA